MMTIKFKVTTIALKIEYADDDIHWTLDTYPRLNAGNDKAFIEKYLTEYQGNGIIDMKVIETVEREYELETLNGFNTIIKAIEQEFGNINTTILDY